MKYTPRKTIFRVDYKPKLCFYDRLFKNINISNKFPHWETNRLQVIFKDFDKNHSLIIANNFIVFESDKYNAEQEEMIIDLILTEILSFVDEGTFTRCGLRRFFLFPQDISFTDLVEIINLKCFSNNFKDFFDSGVSDSTITIITQKNDNNSRIQIGPMKKEEINRFIQINVDNHIDPNPNKRFEELSKIINNYPDVSLFMDIDNYFLANELKKPQLVNFWNENKVEMSNTVEKVIKSLFAEKIKND